MKTSERMTIRKLNNLSEEVFRLYSLGMYQEAISEATKILQIAKEKLGNWHPYTKVFSDNLEFVKTGHVNLGRSNKSKSPNTSSLVNQYSEVTLETSSALKQKYFKQDIRYKSFSNNRLIKPSISKKKLVILLGISGTLITIILSSLFNVVNISLPSVTIKPINSSINLISNIFSGYSYDLKDELLIDAPLILQYPELPRGCEVAALAMLLQYAGISVDKMTLAKDIKKDTTPYRIIDGRIYFGNPNLGFVGNMYTLDEPGFGVYHGPIKDLMEQYLPNQTIDLTGRKFKDLFYFLNKKIPVWVIINTEFKELSPDYFQVWYTSSGPIQITYKQHSVLLTGYDSEYVYFNDPLANGKNQKVLIEVFEKAWNQMGRQAISYLPNDLSLLEILPSN